MGQDLQVRPCNAGGSAVRVGSDLEVPRLNSDFRDRLTVSLP